MNFRDETGADRSETESSDRSSMQFSLRAILIVTAVSAVICFIIISPSWVAGMSLFGATVLAIPAALSLLVYGRGYKQAYGLGTLVPLSVVYMWFAAGPRYIDPFFDFDDRETQIYYVICAFAAQVCGVVAVAVRWWCVRNAE